MKKILLTMMMCVAVGVSAYSQGKTATREQIAAKYLNAEIKGLLAAPAVKAEKSVSMKM